jgi:hypothetical protein
MSGSMADGNSFLLVAEGDATVYRLPVGVGARNAPTCGTSGRVKAMTFDDILEQIITLLKRQGRVSYRALKQRFDAIDADYLNVLKDEILYVYASSVQVDERGFRWTGEVGSPAPQARHFQVLLPAVLLLLQRNKRVTYRTLTYIFGLDDNG